MKTAIIIKNAMLYCFIFFIKSFLYTLCLSLQQPNIVKTLPGYPGDLPFTLETGYIGVGESEDVQLFYYFIESERNVERDPIMVWLTGGPGCSSLSGLILEIGPIALNLTASDTESSVHKLQYNPYAWTKVASIIFLDSPVGTGFSYASNPESYNTSATLQSAHVDDFLRKWIIKHPKFTRSSLYVSGDSYSGMVVPIVIQDILQGNEIGLSPTLNLKGYVLGNPVTILSDFNAPKYEYAYRISLLSDELYKSATISCNNNSTFMDAKNTNCSKNVQTMDQGSIGYWEICNKSLRYEQSNLNSVDYHRNNSKHDLQVLIYNGDQDMCISYVDTLDWIEKLKIPIIDEWRPWFVDGQVSGYTTEYSNLGYRLVYATLKGAGHTGPEYKPRESLAMLGRWFSLSPL